MAAPAVISCPACEKKFKGKPELGGKKIKCPACGNPFTVPNGEAAPAPPPPPPPRPQPVPKDAPIKLADDDEDDSKAYGVTYVDLSARCPNCANKMESEDAIICLFCGYNTQTRSLGVTKKLIQHTLGERLVWLAPGIAGVIAILGLFTLHIYLSVYLGAYVKNSWMSLFDSEAIRLWSAFIVLGIIWATGIFVFKRLIVHPTPPEKEIE